MFNFRTGVEVIPKPLEATVDKLIENWKDFEGRLVSTTAIPFGVELKDGNILVGHLSSGRKGNLLYFIMPLHGEPQIEYDEATAAMSFLRAAGETGTRVNFEGEYIISSRFDRPRQLNVVKMGLGANKYIRRPQS